VQQELKMTILKRTSWPLLFAIVAGALCGVALIATTALSRNGWLMLLPYLALAVAAAIYLRRQKVALFFQRFVACLLAFVVATVMVILYIDLVVHHHAVADMVLTKFLIPTGLMLLIGAAGSAVVAAVTGDRKTAH
jgi:hypothetical protein